MKKILTLCFLVMLVHPAFTNSVEKIVPRIISWTGVEEMQFNGSTIKTPGFIGAVNDDGFGLLPVFSERFLIQNPGTTFDFYIEDAIYQPFEDQSLFDNLADRDLIAFDIQSKTELAVNRRVNYAVFKMLPIRLNLQTGNYEKLLSFNLHINEVQDNSQLKNTRHARDFAATSVLAQGDWFKIAVVESGVYKLSYQQLKDLGMDADAIDPATLQIYGNGAGMLPEKNADYRHDDLRENAIVVEDGKDGSFDEGDFILFYGESQSSWNFVPLKLAFTHTANLYSDSTFYFITSGQQVGKRVSMIAQRTSR